MNAYDFSRKYLYPYKVKGDEIEAKYCPFCRGGDSRDKNTFSLNTVKLTYVCLRGSCGVKGTFKQLCEKFGEKADMDDNYELFKTKRQYKKPTIKIQPATSQAEQYLALRKISKDTMDKLGVGCDDNGNIVFPFYFNGKLEFVKFRPSKKVVKGERKSWREEGTQAILFGMDLCTPEKPLIITEGEIDCLSCYESGIENIVSVPSGSEDFSWVENCWTWLGQFNKIILFGDSDDAGKEMVKKLIIKLGEYRCYTVENNFKDANELLYRDGKNAVRDVVSNAKAVPILGLTDIADVKRVDLRNVERIKTGIYPLDNLIGGLLVGQLSVWTGERGEGKSTLLSQFFAEVVNQGKRGCVYSGELTDSDFQRILYLQTAGKEYIKTKNSHSIDIDPYLDDEIFKKINEWFRGNIQLCDNSIVQGNNEKLDIIKLFTHAVKRYDCKLFLVDNLMTAKYGLSSNEDYYRAQSNFVLDLSRFAKKYNVHVMLVSHPRKRPSSAKKEKFELDNDDVSGIADITNLADITFSLARRPENSVLKIMKSRHFGKHLGTKFALSYCPVSNRLYSQFIGDKTVYNWKELKWYEQAEILVAQQEDVLPF